MASTSMELNIQVSTVMQTLNKRSKQIITSYEECLQRSEEGVQKSEAALDHSAPPSTDKETDI